MRVDYIVGSRGIFIEEAETRRFAPWDEVEIGEYMPIASVFRLWVKGSPRPILLFTLNMGGRKDSVTKRNESAAMHIRVGLSGRLQTKWIPW
jgi:hypothetical protein